MVNLTLKEISIKLKVTIDFLIKQFKYINIFKNANDIITQQDKENLLNYLNYEIFKKNKKITFHRRIVNPYKIYNIGKKNKPIKLVIKKTINYVPTFVNIKKITKYNTKNKSDITNLDSSISSGYKKSYLNKHMKFKYNKFSHYKTKDKHIKITNKNEEDFINYKKLHNNIKKNIDKKNFKYNNLESTYLKNEIDKNYLNSKKIKKPMLNNSSILRPDTNKNINIHKNINNNTKTIKNNIVLGENIDISELSNKISVKPLQIINIIKNLGITINKNKNIDYKIAKLVIKKFGYKSILKTSKELESSIMSNINVNNNDDIRIRAPIVTIMGHVDHGKTSILDCIKSTKLSYSESGGITQRIGAYHVKTKNGNITFLDTPGHLAFTSMRLRSVQITDIIVLVIAADDGVMPQTIESVNYAKLSKVPIIVVVNKIDKLSFNKDIIKSELAKYDIIAEDWGGSNQFVYVSAKSNIGIDDLLEAILLQAEILELKTQYNGMASGYVIESYMDKGLGPVATILIKSGILNKGDIVVCGAEYGRIKVIRNEFRCILKHAEPSLPVEIFGLSGMPIAGDKISVINNEKKAREISLKRQIELRENKLNINTLKLDNIFNNISKREDNKIINIILKSDCQGSLEAILMSINNLKNDNVDIKIIFSGVGNINGTDAALALASNSIMLGFNIKSDIAANKLIKSENLKVKYCYVIYDIISEIKKLIKSKLTSICKLVKIGKAEIRNIFHAKKSKLILGCMVLSGILKRNGKIKIFHKNKMIYEGIINSIRRFKDNVNEVRNGMECGICINYFVNIYKGDIIKSFELVKNN